ncbi:MAG: ATP-NAD kinase family protein [Candidatus Thermoplasmatota archaeon]|nr:ATP-NAD kinase family protein [Candidatus Thermoplasmatota archaeon]
MARRIGMLVNPDAGLGGRLGFKGSDGRAQEARDAGAEDRSGPRMRQALNRCEGRLESVEILTCSGKMGSEWCPLAHSIVFDTPKITTAETTQDAVRALCDAGIELLLYAGGDGTTRDIVEALESPDLPVIGVPGGVKMHSGCFAASPNAAAEVLLAWLDGDLLLARTEVMDLDEEVYREGRWSVRMYGEAMMPASPRWMQGAKMRVEATEEDDVLEALGEHIREVLVDVPDRLVIWGSGGTMRTIAEGLGFSPTLLGIDVTLGTEQIGTDLNENDLLKLINEHEGDCTLLVSPMGGQGFLLGRGNLQLSPEVLRAIGIEAVLGVVTPAKMLTVSQLRIDTGDVELDAEFQNKKYLKVLQGYRTTRLLRIASE